MTRFADFTLGFAGDGLEDGYAYDDEANISGYGFWALPSPSDVAGYGWSLCILSAEWRGHRPVDGTLHCSQMPDGDWARSVDLEFDPIYDRGADSALLAGNWTSVRAPGVDVVSISDDGVLTGRSNATGCVYLGNVRAPYTGHNLYELEWSFADCEDEGALLDGVTLEGLGMIDSTSFPVTLTFIGTGMTKAPPYEQNGRGISLLAVYRKY